MKVQNEDEVKENWEKLKLKEKGNQLVLGGMPASMPALVKAIRIQDKARAVGFDWEKPEQVWEKVQEEISEFREEVEKVGKVKNVEKVEAEFGDVLFSLINYARSIGINSEDALEKTNQKFIKRFQYLESESQKDGKKLDEMTLPEMDVYWNRAKKL